MQSVPIKVVTEKPRKASTPAKHTSTALRLFDESKALGLRGDLQWVPIDALNVDPTYQRPISSKHVHKIFREFDGDLLGVILVSERPSGERYILDGQHRVEAIRMLGHIDAVLPAMVYSHLDQETEAKIFADANKKRLALHPFYTFRARLVAGDASAIALKEIAERYGFHLDYGKKLPGESSTSREEGRIQALGAVEKLQSHYEKPLLAPVLELIANVWGSETIGISAQLLFGLATFLNYYGEMIERDRLHEVLTNLTPKRLELLGKDEPGRGEMAIARVIIKRYNYQLGQKRRLPERQLRRRT